MSNSYCKTCDDSGEVCVSTIFSHDGMEIEDDKVIQCDDCPRCEACDMRVEQGSAPGRVAESWFCCPEHAARTMWENADDATDALIDGANALAMMQRERRKGGDVTYDDEMLTARALVLLAQDAVRDVSEVVVEYTPSEIYRAIVEQGGAR